MVLKNYYAAIERNMKNEISYINQTYSPVSCGLHNGNIINIRVDLANNENVFIEDMAARGVKSFYIENQFIDLSLYQKSVRDNKVIFQMTRNIPLTLSTSYTDVIPSYNGMPIPFDTTGYKKMGMVLLWNKNGSSAVHTIKLVECNLDGSLVNPENILREYPITGGGGYLADFDYNIPSGFIDFKGFIKIQAKSSVAGATPIFDGLWLYMIRR